MSSNDSICTCRVPRPLFPTTTGSQAFVLLDLVANHPLLEAGHTTAGGLFASASLEFGPVGGGGRSHGNATVRNATAAPQPFPN